MGLAAFRIPPFDPRAVVRESLLNHIKEQSPRLIFAIAPGGYGKSTLMQQWVASRGAAMWCELDDSCQSSRGFVQALLRALVESNQFAGTLWEERLSYANEFSDASASLEWFFEVLENADCEWSFCIDELHLLEGTEAAAQLDSFLQGALKSRGSIMLAGRKPHSAKSFARLQSRLDVLCLEPKELSFDIQDVEGFLRKSMSAPLDDSLTQTLFDVSSGWPALVALMTKSLLRSPEAMDQWLSGDVDAKSMGIHSYLELEYLENRPEMHRQFLLTMALLAPVPEELCEHLLPDQGRRIARELVDDRFVRVESGETGPIYSLHHLVQDFLVDRSHEEFSAKLRERMFHSAGQWYALRGLYHEAFKHFKLAGQMEPILNQLERWEVDFVEYWSEYSRWLLDMDPELLQGRIRLQIRMGMNHANLGNIAESYRWLARARAETVQREDQAMLAIVRAAESIVAFFAGEYDRSMDLCEQLEAEEHDHDFFLLGCLYTARVLLHNNSHVNVELAQHYVRQYEKLVEQTGYARGWLVATANGAVAARIRGDLSFQLGVPDTLKARWGDRLVPTYFQGMILFSEALALLELGLPIGVVRMEYAIGLLERIGAENQASYGKAVLDFVAAEAGEPSAGPTPKVTQGIYAADAALNTHLAQAMRAAQVGALDQVHSAVKAALDVRWNSFSSATAYLECGRALALAGDLLSAQEMLKQAATQAAEYGLESILYRANLVAWCIDSTQPDASKPKQKQSEYANFEIYREAMFMAKRVTSQHAMPSAGRGEFSVCLLGGLKVFRGAHEVRQQDWGRPQARAVFAFLMLHHPRSVHSEEIIEAFWPEASPTSGRANLKTTLSRIRRALGSDDTIYMREGMVGVDLGSTYTFDIEVLRELAHEVTSGSADANQVKDMAKKFLDEALEHFLPEHMYSDWAASARTQWEMLIQDVYLVLGRSLLECRRFSEAVTLAQDMMTRDPLGELGYRMACDGYRGLGQTAEAHRIWVQFSDRVREAFGLDMVQSEAEFGISHVAAG